MQSFDGMFAHSDRQIVCEEKSSVDFIKEKLLKINQLSYADNKIVTSFQVIKCFQ